VKKQILKSERRNTKKGENQAKVERRTPAMDQGSCRPDSRNEILVFCYQ